jgi:uncharacterized protein DUF2017
MIWISRKKDGGWAVWFASSEISDLEKLPGQLRGVLANPDFSSKVIARLFPQAYRDDPEREAEFQRLLRDDLLQRKLEGVAAFERTLANRKETRKLLGFSLVQVDLTGEELTLWMGFFHDMRLLIGTRLDITDESWQQEIDPRDPRAGEFNLLHKLAYIEETVIQALRKAEKWD